MKWRARGWPREVATCWRPRRPVSCAPCSRPRQTPLGRRARTERRLPRNPTRPCSNVPLHLVARPLVTVADWQAYERLRPGSLANFDGDGPVAIGAESFFAVWPSATAFLAGPEVAPAFGPSHAFEC